MVKIRAEDCRGQSQGMGLGSKVTFVSWARMASLVSEAVDDDQVLVKVTCAFIHNGPVQCKGCVYEWIRTQLTETLLRQRDTLRVKGQWGGSQSQLWFMSHQWDSLCLVRKITGQTSLVRFSWSPWDTHIFRNQVQKSWVRAGHSSVLPYGTAALWCWSWDHSTPTANAFLFPSLATLRVSCDCFLWGS